MHKIVSVYYEIYLASNLIYLALHLSTDIYGKSSPRSLKLVFFFSIVWYKLNH